MRARSLTPRSSESRGSRIFSGGAPSSRTRRSSRRVGASASTLDSGFALTSPTTRESFDQKRGSVVKSGKKTEPVSGVGDDAFFWWDPKPGSTRQVGIALRSGRSELIIMDLTTADSIEAMKPRILAVAKSVVPRVR